MRLARFAAPAAAFILLASASPGAHAAAAIGQPYQWGGHTGWPSDSPVVGGPAGAAVVNAQNTFSMAIMPSGVVMAWGSGTDGDLGDGSTASSQQPVQVAGLSGITQVDGGDSDAIALQASTGEVFDWGNNDQGQLGQGTSGGYDATPQQVSLPGPACAVAGGGFKLSAMMCDGTVYDWGDGWHGQLGDGSGTSSDVPVKVTGLSGITSVTAGNLFSLAENAAGQVWFWGFNGYGQSCDGGTSDQDSPQAIPALQDATQISAGGNEPVNGHLLALMPSGAVLACGQNADGQLGDGATVTSPAAMPVTVTGLPPNVTQVSAGGLSSMALSAAGGVWDWGGNSSGQVGDGSTSDALQPVKVLSGAIQVSAGSMHDLALAA